MNKLLEINRDLDQYKTTQGRTEEMMVRKFMESYGYDHENARKAFEHFKFQQAQFLFCKA